MRCYADGQLVAGLPSRAKARATIEAIDDAGLALGAVAGWSQRDVTKLLKPVGQRRVAPETGGTPRALQLDLDVNEVFASVDQDLIECYFGFGSLFNQRFRVTLDVDSGGMRIASAPGSVRVRGEGRAGCRLSLWATSSGSRGRFVCGLHP